MYVIIIWINWIIFKMNFLITENSVSNAGYHNNTTIKSTEKSSFVLKKSIAIYPIILEIE